MVKPLFCGAQGVLVWEVGILRQRGLTIIYTGNGKGKTTAAMGQVMRAVGHGLTACVIQFIKGKWVTGEAKTCQAMPGVEFHTMGTGFTWKESPEATRQAAEHGWALAVEKIMSGVHDLVVLDELTYLVTYQLVAESTVLELIRHRPSHVHLVISGRDASSALIEAADLVTEMREIKHPYHLGVTARAGIEF